MAEVLARAVNSNMVIAYWLIGREIVQELQRGEQRAEYGRQLLSELSASLTQRYGRGFSATNLKYFRLVFQAYAERQPVIRHESRDELPALDQAAVLDDLASAVDKTDRLRGFSPRLSWTHYRTLSTVEQRAERLFYEIEAERCGWSQPVLERQIHSHLFVRLLKSRDKARGLILCAERDEVVARYSVLHESEQLFASKYLLYLPTEAELRAEIARDQAAIEATRRLEG